jgi:hypothetical protein
MFNAVISNIRHKIGKNMDIIIFPKVADAQLSPTLIEKALETALARI